VYECDRECTTRSRPYLSKVCCAMGKHIYVYILHYIPFYLRIVVGITYLKIQTTMEKENRGQAKTTPNVHITIISTEYFSS